MQARKQWLRSRREHLKRIREMVEARLPSDSEEVASYTRSFLAGFSRHWRASDRSELLSAISNSRIVMISDFHAHGQSQRVIRRLLQALPAELDVVVAVEFLEARHQAVVEKYSKGDLPASELREEIDWDNRWGFSWRTYHEIIEATCERGSPLYGVNLYESVETENSMYRRDVFAAKKLNELLIKYPQSCILVVFGELHLASDRLPRRIIEHTSLKKSDLLTVFQNPEKLYFKLAEQGKESVLDVIRTGERQFAIMGTPPWVKWQNYLLFLQKTYDRGFSEDWDESVEGLAGDWDEDEDWDDEPEVDLDALVANYIDLIAKDFSFDVQTDTMSVYSATDDHFWHKLKDSLPQERFKIARLLMIANESLYIPAVDWAYLSQLSVNHVTAVAGRMIHSQVAKIEELPWKVPTDFEKLIWVEAVSFFFSKWINPHRKSDTLQDIQEASADSSHESLLLALDQKFIETLPAGYGRKRKVVPRRKLSYFRAARILGGMIGEKLYYGYKQGVLPDLESWIRSPLETSNFANQYRDWVSVLEKVKVPYLSKKERF